jgi:hypothetical protein
MRGKEIEGRKEREVTDRESGKGREEKRREAEREQKSRERRLEEMEGRMVREEEGEVGEDKKRKQKTKEEEFVCSNVNTHQLSSWNLNPRSLPVSPYLRENPQYVTIGRI